MTLTQAASLTRKIFFFSIFIIVSSIVGFIGYKIYTISQQPAKINPSEQIDTRFGILPNLDFSKTATSSGALSYSLNLPQGLPELKKVAKVFFIPKPVGILSSQDADNLAQKFGFSNLSEKKENIYSYTESLKSQVIDLDSANFIYQKEATASALNPIVDNDSKLTDDFKNFLSSKINLTTEFKNAKSKINRLDSTRVQISLLPNDLDQFPLITPYFNRSFITGTVTKSARDLDNYLFLQYFYYPIDTATFSVYPLKTSNEGFQVLQAGEGAVLIKPNRLQVSITSVYLAYYQPENYTPYLQPVIVFEGPEFVAVVPAVNSQYLNSTK